MSLDFKKICRLCLHYCKEYVDLRQTNGVKNLSSEVMERIKFCYFIQIDPTDGLPTRVCYQCVQIVTLFYITKKNASTSEQMLRDILYIRKEKEARQAQCVADNAASLKKLQKKENHTPDCTEPAKKVTKKNESTNFPNVIVNLGSASNSPYSEFLDESSNEEEVREYKEDGIRLKKVKVKNKTLLLDDTVKGRELNETEGPSGNNKLKIKTVRVTDSFQTLEDLNEITILDTEESNEAQESTDIKPRELLKVVKNIGTDIDESNILSPNVKRARTTVIKKA